jgi:phosphoenolpyruvate carboxykinase (ATP)
MQTPTRTSIRSLIQSPHVYVNLSEAELVAHCLEKDGCVLTPTGAVAAYTGKYTGRTPKDKYIVRDLITGPRVWWGGNNEMTPETYSHVREKIFDFLTDQPLYVVDAFAGADPNYRIKVRFIVQRAYHALFVKQLLLRPTAQELTDFEPEWTIVNASQLSMNPATDEIRGDAVIALNLSEKEVMVAGTQYAGELKKSVFSIMNYLLPLQGVMSMHCSANIGHRGDTCLFFGLSGTGKTSLSADPHRLLIGDDEHGWSNSGVFNIEGGCYAKCIGLRKETEPDIWNAITDGTVLENVVLGPDGTPNYDDSTLTENTRAAYPLDHIPHAVHPSVGDHPKNVIFLTCDAIGVLPPLSRLSQEQALTYFLNGYTAKVAGTEAGVTEPSVTFSACFGQPFLPLPPRFYGDLLREQVTRHHSRVWLLNTGWTEGPDGVGHRIPISLTRAMLHAAVDGKLDKVEFRIHPIFGIEVPVECPGVPTELLDPRSTWPDQEAYDAKARDLQRMFEENAIKMGAS